MISATWWTVIFRAIKTARWRDILTAVEVTVWALLLLMAMILAPTWAMVVLIIPLVTMVSGTTWWAVAVALALALEVVLFVRRRARARAKSDGIP